MIRHLCSHGIAPTQTANDTVGGNRSQEGRQSPCPVCRRVNSSGDKEAAGKLGDKEVYAFASQKNFDGRANVIALKIRV